MARRRRQQVKKVKYYSPKRRAIYAKGDEIDPFVLFQLHGWICCVCREPINRFLRLPNIRAATIEHIVPLCRGGTHTWDNVAPAHANCNFQKADSLPNDLSDTMVA